MGSTGQLTESRYETVVLDLFARQTYRQSRHGTNVHLESLAALDRVLVGGEGALLNRAFDAIVSGGGRRKGHGLGHGERRGELEASSCEAETAEAMRISREVC